MVVVGVVIGIGVVFVVEAGVRIGDEQRCDKGEGVGAAKANDTSGGYAGGRAQGYDGIVKDKHNGY